MYIRRTPTSRRRAVILLVVLAILTLFSILGITFVLYSEAAALSARVAKDAQNYIPPDMDPEECLSLFLGQLIYDVSDTDRNGVMSALRGHSLARNKYGWNVSSLYNAMTGTGGTMSNTTPYNGVGRLHFVYPSSVAALNGYDDWQLINYTYFNSNLGASITGKSNNSDGFLRDPEYMGVRPNGPPTTTNPSGTYVGGINPTYTYPDLNNLYLGVLRPSDGLVLARSYHRDYTGFGPFYTYSGGTWTLNSNWQVAGSPTSPAAATLKYMVLRPRSVDHNGFPDPQDAGGDVKNLVTSPGYLDPQSGQIVNNDSFWIDIGAPVLTAPDGRKYKMLVAPFITDLDGKVNLNATGNIRGQSNGSISTPLGGSTVATEYTHMSNLGYGPWEINPFKVLVGTSPTETGPAVSGSNVLATWTNLFAGMNLSQPPAGTGWSTVTGPSLYGKYGPGQVPTYNGNAAAAGRAPHYYAQVDVDGCANYSGPGTGQVTGALEKSPPVAGNPDKLWVGTSPPNIAPYLPFPSYPATGLAGYENGGQTAAGNASYTELTDHPLLYDVLNPYPAAGGRVVGSGLTLSLTATSGAVSAVTIGAAGTGYAPSATFYVCPLQAGGAGCTVSVTTNGAGVPTSATLVAGGSGYTTATVPAVPVFNRTFTAEQLERLLRFGDTSFQSLTSDVERLSPENFNAQGDGVTVNTNSWKRRWLVTTHSTDVIRPGLTPYIFSVNPTGTSATPSPYAYTMNATDAYLPPTGASIPYLAQATAPTLTYGTPPTLPPAGTTAHPGQPGEYSSDFRASGVFSWPQDAPSAAQNLTAVLQTALGRINLNRTLTPYIVNGSGTDIQDNTTTDPNYYAQYNTNPTQYAQALADRQQFADDIYRRLLLVAGVPPVATPGTPTLAELSVRRWLAQLAVNIVDYIDEDDIITPFNFYNQKDDPTFGTMSGPQLGDCTALPSDTRATANDTQYQYGAPKYWVFGTELPHVTINEVMAECQDAKNGDNTSPQPGGATTPWTVAVWAELRNNLVTPPSNCPGQPQDGYPVELTNGAGHSAPYRVVLAGGLYSPSPSTTANDNVLGQYLGLKSITADADFNSGAASTWAHTPNPLGTQSLAPYTSPFVPVGTNTTVAGKNVTNNAYFVLGPTAALVSNTTYFADPLSQSANSTVVGTPFLRTANMAYQPVGTGGTFVAPDERGTGLTILLQRLANPHLPFQPNPNPAAGTYNPYVTMDYVDQVPIWGQNISGSQVIWQSRGKTQSFAGFTQIGSPQYPNSPVVTPTANSPTQNESASADTGINVGKGVQHTFGGTNTPVPSGSIYNWLVHLDRQVVSPMELLNVSAYPPHYLTNKFLSTTPPGTTVIPYNHYAPWFDPNETAGTPSSNRLYRLFEYLDTNNRGAGVALNGRISGKININSIWEVSTLDALCDPNNSNWVANDSDISTIFTNMMTDNALANARSPMTPTGYSSPNTSPGLPRDYNSGTFVSNAAGAVPSVYTAKSPDRPFLSFGTGWTQAPTGPAAAWQFIKSRGIEDTLLRTRTVSGHTGRMLEKETDYNPPPASPVHPYLQYQLLTKIFNNVTTRSNVFAVWVTVGFFEVTDDTTIPPTLGAEVGKSEGRNVRHRMFAIVDRTNLSAFQTTVGTGGITTTGSATAINLSATSYTEPRTNQPVALPTAGGFLLTYDPGTDNEEDVYVTSVSGSLQATFQKTHAAGAPVIVRGNPGPWTRYDVRQDSNVVLYWNIYY